MPEYHDNDFSDLDELQPDWVTADEDMDADVPDGIYQVQIDKIELTHVKGEGPYFGKPMLCWTLKILGPHHIDRLMFDNQLIHNIGDDPAKVIARQLGFVKSRLNMLGHVPEKLSDLADDHVLERYLDLVVEIQQKTTEKKGKTFVNIRFRKLLELDGSTTPDEGRGF